MTTSLKNKDSELQSRNAHLINGTSGSKKWILYTTGKDPLLGFVHAPSMTEALDRVRAFKIPIIAVEADAPATAEPMTAEAIERHFELFGSIIPAFSDGAGRHRTSYFYRQQAIQWAQMARQWWPGGAMQPICRKLAKNYLAQYRFMQATA